MSKSNFSFGTTGSGGSTGIFGQPSQTGSSTTSPASNPFAPASATQQSGVFGGSAAQPASTGSSFAPVASTAGGQRPLTFGSNPPSTPGSGTATPLLFGANAGNTGAGQATGLFGGGGTVPGGSNTFGGASGFTFGKKTEEKKETSAPATLGFPTLDKSATPAQGEKANPFAVSSFSSGASAFGAATSSAPAGSTTPATTKPGGSFSFANSTTPAGPPPADSNTGAKATGGGFFGSTAPSSGGLFGAQKSSASASPMTSQPTGLFGGTATSTPTTNMFAPKTTSSANPLSALSGANQNTPGTSTPATTSSAATTGPRVTFNFTPTAPTAASSAAPQAPNLFGALTSASPTTTTSILAPAQTAGNFGAVTATTSSTATPAQNSSAFSLGQPTNTTAPSSTAATSSAPAPASSMFPPRPTAAASESTPASTAPRASTSNPTAATSVLGASISNPLGASTAGPAPQFSRLKNKTMDEIITRWATDLSTYQKEFQSQAAKVSAWDRLLVDNGDKIQKLYTSTFEAERASAEVERQLVHVESQQEELTAWLDHYEREVNDMFVKQVGSSESLQGPDQERERTYKLAEKLTDRLDEMGKDLTSMIQEINAASASLTKTSKTDDPLSQIVKVLNGHLSQLQWIDQNASTLQAKVAAAQKAGQSLSASGYAGPESDAADDFYRSYMGRR